MKWLARSLVVLCCSTSLTGCLDTPPPARSGSNGGASGSASAMSGAGGTALNAAAGAETGAGTGGVTGGAGGTAGGVATGGGGSPSNLAGSGGSGGALLTGAAAWMDSPFVMDTWFWNDGASMPPRDIEIVEAHGFKAFALTADHQVPGYVAALSSAQLPMVGMFTPSALGGYPTGAVDAVAGTGGYIWLAIPDSPPYQRSDAAGDAKALELISKLADECQAKGLAGVALYPHQSFWMQSVADAVRLAGKAARPDVGIVFNQYHWMVVDQGKALEATLQSAAPYLKFVTINGSDAAPSILPLGEGAYDPLPILEAVAALDFQGGVGLQGFSISGDIDAKLAASKQVWDGWMAQIAP